MVWFGLVWCFALFGRAIPGSQVTRPTRLVTLTCERPLHAHRPKAGAPYPPTWLTAPPPISGGLSGPPTQAAEAQSRCPTHPACCMGPEAATHASRTSHSRRPTHTVEAGIRSSRTEKTARRSSFQRAVIVRGSVTVGRSPSIRRGFVHSVRWRGHRRHGIGPFIHAHQGQSGVEGWGRESLG